MKKESWKKLHQNRYFCAALALQLFHILTSSGPPEAFRSSNPCKIKTEIMLTKLRWCHKNGRGFNIIYFILLFAFVNSAHSLHKKSQVVFGLLNTSQLPQTSNVMSETNKTEQLSKLCFIWGAPFLRIAVHTSWELLRTLLRYCGAHFLKNKERLRCFVFWKRTIIEVLLDFIHLPNFGSKPFTI